MTLDEFRADKSLMLELERCTAVKALVSVLDDEARNLWKIGTTGERSADFKIEALGHIQGFNKAVYIVRKCLEAPPPPTKEIIANYGAVEPSAKGKKT